MKKRVGVFETNSSSTHSITLTTEGLLDTLYPNPEGTLRIPGQDFGWEYEEYTDALSKASYAAIYAKEWSTQPTNALMILEDILKSHTGATTVIFADDGYIDHQSVEDHDLEYLFEDPEQLRQFIFNPKSVLKTNNDNR